MRDAVLVVLLFAVLIPRTPCTSQTEQIGSLEGLDSVAVLIRQSGSTGLTRTALRREMESAIEQAGIRLLRRGPPSLSLRIQAPRQRSGETLWLVSVWVNVDAVSPSIWRESSRGYWEPGYEVLDEVKELLAVFVRQHRIQNPTR